MAKAEHVENNDGVGFNVVDNAPRVIAVIDPKLFWTMATAAIVESLRPGQPGALKAKADGTVLEGHRRLVVLRERGVDINARPRETHPQEPQD